MLTITERRTISMFTQSKSEIVYQEERWVNWMLIAVMVPVVSGGVFLIEASLSAKSWPDLGLSPEYLAIASPPLVAAILTWWVLTKISYLDRMVITTEGLTYCHTSGERHYPWSQLNDLVFVDCGRGGGYYRIYTSNNDKPVRVNLPPFGVSREEFEKVFSSARGGKLLDVAALRVEIANRDRETWLSGGHIAIASLLSLIVMILAVSHMSVR